MQPNIHRGRISAEGLRFAVVVSRWNEFLTSKLLSGALDALGQHGAEQDAISVFEVPGAFEIPQTMLKAARTGRFDAVIGLGVVIRGETPHFDYVAGEAAKGIAQVGMETGVPSIFGVLTTDTLEQAINRCGGKAGNKGYEAAVAAIEVANLHKQIAELEQPAEAGKVRQHVV